MNVRCHVSVARVIAASKLVFFALWIQARAQAVAIAELHNIPASLDACCEYFELCNYGTTGRLRILVEAGQHPASNRGSNLRAFRYEYGRRPLGRKR